MTDFTGKIGSVVMLCFAAGAAMRWHETGLLFFSLTCLRDLAAAGFLCHRRADRSDQGLGWPDLVAYASSAMPLSYLDGHALSVWPDALSILGFALATVALFDLGRSFGVSPANRGFVRSGVYRAIPHPMYTGYLLSELGMCVLQPRNLPLLAISATLYVLRARLESALFTSCQRANGT